METDGSGPLSGSTAVPHINPDICSGCGRCVAVCPGRIITLEVAGFRKHALITHPDRCSLCGRCATECPTGAVSP